MFLLEYAAKWPGSAAETIMAKVKSVLLLPSEPVASCFYSPFLFSYDAYNKHCSYDSNFPNSIRNSKSWNLFEFARGWTGLGAAEVITRLPILHLRKYVSAFQISVLENI